MTVSPTTAQNEDQPGDDARIDRLRAAAKEMLDFIQFGKKASPADLARWSAELD